MRVYMYGREVCGRRQGGKKAEGRGERLRWGKRREAEVRKENAGVWVECG